MSNLIAFFDFDGTVTKKDTLLEFIRYCKGDFSFYSGFIFQSPILVAYMLNIISNQYAKEKVLHYFFRKMPVTEFEKKCEEFSEKIIPSLIRQKAYKEIRMLQDAGAELVIVSASPENWVRRWSDTLHLQCLATRLELTNNKISGKISGKNCHGQEKVRRINEAYDLSRYNEIYCYGDSPGDRPMLSLATISFYQPFR